MLKRRKKGFTLIEMMAVIAIIAILVAILVPTVTSYTNRANAAANAANLRTIKGQVSTLLLSGQITYKTSATADALIEYQEELLAEANAALATANRVEKWTLENITIPGIQVTLAMTVAAKNVNNTYYAEDGEIDIDGVVLNAPAAKAINIGDLMLRKETQMIVQVTEDQIIVTYGGLPLDVIAVVAEGGDATDINWTEFSHTYLDANGDDVCDYCKNEYPHTDADKAGDLIENAGNTSHTRCYDENSDCICDYENCKLKIPCTDNTWGGDGYCNNCGACMGFTDSRRNPDGKCNTCGKTEAEH